MSALLVELEKQACSLLPEERAHLAEVLLESLHDSPPIRNRNRVGTRN